MEISDKLKEFKWPDRLINSATAAKTYVDQINESHKRHWDITKMMEHHIDGQRPVDPAKMKQGRSWQNNWNYGKARAKLEKLTTANIDTALNAIAMCSVRFRELTKAESEDPDHAWFHSPELRDVVSENVEMGLNQLIEEETRILSWFNAVEYSATAWGYCPIIKDKRIDWLGRPVHIRTIGFPGKTKPEDVRSFVIFDTISAETLWRTWHDHLKNESNFQVNQDPQGQVYRESPSGWIKEGVEEALYHSYNGKVKDKDNVLISSFEEIVPEFVNDCSMTMLNTDKIRIATIYQLELDGKSYTKSIIAYGNGWKQEAHGNRRYSKKSSVEYNSHNYYDPKFFLFQQEEPIESVSEILSIVLDTGFTTNTYIQDIRGLARWAVEDSIRYNRKKNMIEDKLAVAGSPFIRKNASGNGDEGPRIAPAQGFNVISEGFDFVPDQPVFNTQNHLYSLQMDEQDYKRETEHYDPNVSGRLSSRPVTEEVRTKRAEVERIEGSKLNIKLKSYADVFLGMIQGLAYHLESPPDSALSSEAKRGFKMFKERLIHDLKAFNIDDDRKLAKVLKLVDKIVMDPVITNAEAIIEQLNQATTPYVRRRLQRMLALARGFSRKEINLMYPLNREHERYTQAQIAAVENHMLRDTVEVVWQESDDHLGHLDFHFSKAFALIEQIMAAESDPVPIYNHLARITEHSVKHVEHLYQMPYLNEGVVVKYADAFKQLMQGQAEVRAQVEAYAKQVQEQAQQQAEQEQGQQMDPQTQAKIQMAWEKLRNDEEIKRARSEFRAEEIRKDNEFRRQLKREDHEEKKQRQAEMAQLKRELELLKTNTNLTPIA